MIIDPGPDVRPAGRAKSNHQFPKDKSPAPFMESEPLAIDED